MPLFGTLKTLPLADLLQWVGTTRLTGTLRLERNKVAKWILFREGQVVGCSSDDPPERLGQYLIARGRITETQLLHALRLQESLKKHLGVILEEMGAIDADELTRHLESKAEETILSLFEWTDGVFRFDDGLGDESNVFSVRLPIDDLLLRGVHRYDEIQRIRQVFHDPRMVVRPTSRKPPEELLRHHMACRLYEAIDGERTLAEIRLHVRGSEFVVLKFLFELERSGYIELAGIRPALRVAEPPPLEATPTAAETAPREAAPPVLPSSTEVDRPAAPESPFAAALPEPAAPPVGASETATGVELQEASPAYRLERQLHQCRSAMERSDFEAALAILDDLYRAHPGDESLARLTKEAEVAFVEKAYRHFLPPSKVPRLTRSIEELSQDRISPAEYFLLSRIDGNYDVRSITLLAPLREVDILRTLKRLRESGVIELQEPADG